MGDILHFCLLIRKNFKIHLRYPFSVALQFLIPIVFMLLLLFLRLSITIYVRDIETPFSAYHIETLPERFNSTENIIVYYTPQSSFLDGIMASVGKQLSVTPIGFDTEEELVSSYVKSNSRIIGGVNFAEYIKNGVEQYGPISITIRPESIHGNSWNLSHYLPVRPLPELNEKSIYGSDYMSYGFLTLQHAVSKALIESSIPEFHQQFDNMFEVRMHRFPFPQYESDFFYKLPEHMFSFVICLSFLYPSIFMAKCIVKERQIKLKQTLMMMGVSNWQNWLAWFFKDFLLLFFISLIITLLLCIHFGGPAVLNRSDMSLIFLLLLLYSCNTIVSTYFITTFFQKEKSASAATCILFLLTILPQIHSRDIFHHLPVYTQIIFCILPNTLFGYSWCIIISLEQLGKGLLWKTMHYTEIIDVNISMNTVFLMFIIEFLMFALLTWYSEVMHPDKFCAKHPWYFPFTAYYWTGKKDIGTEPYPPLLQRVNSKQFEAPPRHVRPMINLINVTKVYDHASNPVLNNINLRAYKGQITVILSHEDAGKSTIASMLYGILSPTSGSIFVKDSDISIPFEARRTRALLGICPDYDVNIEEFTIEENLYFFCKVKGVDDLYVNNEVYKILESFDLEIIKSHLASSMTLNVKRKLTIGISLIGGSEVVILDEPTLHLNELNTKMVWEVLRQAKKYRCILLMTSNVGEANNLADQIAVIHNGELKCSGSPLFLKKRHGIGYRTIVPKLPDCKINWLKHAIRTKIPDTYVVSDTENEIQFILPHDSRHLYASFFQYLEESDLNIGEMTVGELSLEIWFERMTGERHLDATKIGTVKSFSSICENEKPCYRNLTKERNEGFTLFSQHIRAVFRKQYISSKRNIFMTLSQIIILPLLFIFSILMESNAYFFAMQSLAEGQFTMDFYKNTSIAYGIDGSSNTTIGLGDTYASLLDETGLMYMVDLDREDYLTYLLEQAKKNVVSYQTKYVIGAEFSSFFNKSLITAYYNPDAYHSAPTSLLYVYNSILTYLMKGTKYYFDVRNNPLPYKDEYKLMHIKPLLDISLYWAEDLMIGMALLMACFVVVLSNEKVTKSKQQQILCGLNAFVYWLSIFFYNFLVYLLPLIISLVVFSAFQVECFSGIDEVGILILLFVLHGISGLLFVQCASVLFSSPPTAFVGVFLFYFVGLCFLVMICYMEVANMYYISEPLNILFTVVMPSYCVGRGVYNVHRNCLSYYMCTSPSVTRMCKFRNATDSVAASCCLDTCGDKCVYWSASHFSVTAIPGIGKQLICLAVQPFILWFILILLELKIFPNLKCRWRKTFTAPSEQNINEDVMEEAKRINSLTVSELKSNNHYLVVKGASKFLNSEKTIKNITFGVKKGECFGLLGLEEAGKSTVLNMIAGNICIETGDVYIDGYNLAEEPHKMLDKVGFNFGSSALFNNFTIEETLTFYAHIRGIPENKLPYFIESLNRTLKLKLDTIVKKCNEAEKRKLSVAIAIIGTPPLILLDEPTAKLDPVESMHIMKAINQVLKMGCTVIFSSKRMDECLALCNRIGILFGDKMTYIGDFKTLKQLFQGGFILSLNVTKLNKVSIGKKSRKNIDIQGRMQVIREIIKSLLTNAVLKMEYSSYLYFYIPERLITWSKIFAKLEQLIEEKFLFDYSICEATIEHMFIYLVSDSPNDLKDKKILDALRIRKKSRF